MTATRRRAWAALVAVLALLVATVPAFTSPASATPAGASCAGGSLEKAPVLNGDIGRNGHPVAETTLADGTSIPVLMVHGWTGQSVHNNERKGNFSKLIDLTANKVGTASVGRSLIGQIQDAGGTDVYTFDYYDASARWVTDAAIGPILANSITCLSAAYGHPIILMVHSMGGLATRQAFSLIQQNPDAGAVSDYVSDVVTFGTPNTGSWLSSVVEGGNTAASVGQVLPGGTGATIAAVRSILVLCGTATTASMKNQGICKPLGDQVSSSRSQAGKALRIGSPEMSALAAWPDSISIHALAGSIDLELRRVAWFGLTRSAGAMNTGDFVVGVDSAISDSTENRDLDCFYTLDFRGAVEDNIAADWLKIKAANETRDNVYTNLTESACFHGNLMRSIELTNEALGIIVDIVDRADATARLEAAVPEELRGTWCTRSGDDPRGLVDGEPDPCFSFAELFTDRPEAGLDYFDPSTATTGAFDLAVCLTWDLDNGCTTASTMYFDYYPAGVTWDCEAYVGADTNGRWPSCDPDFTSAHDPAQPRLTIVYNHQQAPTYMDSEPMYRR